MKRLLLLLMLVLLAGTLLSQTYGEIGTGTTSTNLPTYALWSYSWSTAIYPATGFGGARSITKLAFNHINASNTTMNNQKIYLKETSLTAFPSLSYENPLTNGYTLVYDGAITTVTGWTEIDITDFNYGGSNNLIIHWENRSGQSNSITDWYSTSCTAGLLKCYGSDTSFPASGGWAPFPVALPNLRYYYASDNPATPVNPAPAINQTAVSLEGNLSFTLGNNTTGYQVRVGTTAENLTTVATQNVSTPGVYTYTPPTAWQPDTTYFWRVIATNSTSNTQGPLWNFSTEGLITSFPYSEGFEGTTFPPNGWFRSSEAWTQASYPHSGTSCAKVNYYHSTPAILKTPRIQLPSTPMRLHFFWCDSDDISRIAGHDSTYFEISTDLGQTWTTLSVLSAPSYQSAYHEYTLDLHAYTNQNVYLRWRDVTDGSLYAYGALIDDLLIEPISSNPVIDIQPSSLVFPETGVSIPVTLNATITNLGSTTLSFSGVLNSGFFTCQTPAPIAPSQSISIPITYLPGSSGNHTGSITFQINGTYSGNNVLALSGSAYTLLSSLFENFDASANFPAHWIAFEDGTNQYTGVTVRNSSFDAYSGTNSIRMYNSAEDVSNVNILLMTPALGNLADNVLSFFAKSSWGLATDTLILGYIANPDNPASFVPVQTLNLTANYVRYTHTFAANITAHHIAFKHGLGGAENYAVYLDDIGWEASGNIPNPATAGYPSNAATNVRLDYIGKRMSSKLQWSSGGGDPTGYRIYLGTGANSFNLINGTDLGLVDTLSVAISLNYNTAYYWKLVPYNINGNAENCPVWSFTTMADPTVMVTSAASYFQGFESADIGTIPLGWELDNLDNDNAYWTAIGNSTSSQNTHTGLRAAHITFSFMTTHNDWLYSPPLYLTAGAQCNVSFWYKSIDFPGDPCVEKLEVKWGTLPSPMGMLSTIFYNDNIVSPTPYTMFTGTITAPADGVYFIGFHCFSDPMQFILLLDDITISVAVPNDDNHIVPVKTSLHGAYPNPFSPQTNVKYSLSHAQPLELNVFNIKGQKICSLVNANVESGEHQVVWNGKDDNGKAVSSGMYFIRMSTKGEQHVQKVILIR